MMTILCLFDEVIQVSWIGNRFNLYCFFKEDILWSLAVGRVRLAPKVRNVDVTGVSIIIGFLEYAAIVAVLYIVTTVALGRII